MRDEMKINLTKGFGMKTNLCALLFCVGIMAFGFSLTGMNRSNHGFNMDSLRDVVSGDESRGEREIRLRVADGISSNTCNCSKIATVVLASVLAVGVFCFISWIIVDNTSKPGITYSITDAVGNWSVG